MRNQPHHAIAAAGRRRATAILCACAGLAAQATATLVVLPDDETLVDHATAIVIGEVASVTPLADRPATDIALFGVQRVAGRWVPEQAVVRIPGGIDGQGRGLVIAGLRQPSPGDRLLVFLDPGEQATYRPHGLMLGIFYIETLADRSIAHRQLGGAHLLPRADGGGVADAPRDLAAWRSWIADRARGLIRGKDYFVAATPDVSSENFRLATSSTLPAPLGCGSSGGNPIRWTGFDAGEVLGFARGGSLIDGLESGGATALATALAAWSDQDGSAVVLTDAGPTTAMGGLLFLDGTSSVLTGDPNDSLPGRFEGAGLLALGGAWLDCTRTVRWNDIEVHPVLEADIVIQDGIERFFEASGAPEAAAAELFAHELGHALGFAHSDDSEALMFGLIHDDGRGALLGPDDRAARALLYPSLESSGPISGPPPPTPTAIVAWLADDHVAVTWQLETIDAAGDPRGVLIERQTDDGPFSLLASVGNAESYFDRELLPGTTYSYRLIAFGQGGASEPSAVVSVTTAGTIAPRAPTNLRAAPLSTSSVRLSWQDNADDELFYRVEGQSGGVWEALPETVPANTTEVVIGGLEHGRIYRLRIRAVGVFAASEPAGQVAVRTLPPEAGCSSQAARLCLLRGRFAASVRFRNPRLGNTIALASAVAETDNTGRFWFFRESNTELIVKMIDASTANGFAWVFYGGLSDLEYWVDITDTETGKTGTYHNPPGALCGIADTQAFPLAAPLPAQIEPLRAGLAGSLSPRPHTPRVSEPPQRSARSSSGSSPCIRDDETLCLLNGRFAVRVDFVNQHAGGEAGVGRAIDGSDQTGFFYFFNLRNTELVIKMLDGRSSNDHFWMFYGGLSNVQYEITVIDTDTGSVRTFFNRPGEICGGKDTSLFFEPLTP